MTYLCDIRLQVDLSRGSKAYIVADRTLRLDKLPRDYIYVEYDVDEETVCLPCKVLACDQHITVRGESHYRISLECDLENDMKTPLMQVRHGLTFAGWAVTFDGGDR